MSSTRQHLGLSLMVLSLALILGWLGVRFSTGLDLTANRRHGLSDGTRTALAALDEPVELIAVLGPDPGVRNAVSELVQRYRDLAPDLTLRFVNPDTDPATARELGAAPGGELILRSAAREQRLQRLDERALTGALRKLTREGALQIGFVVGHGERDPVATTDDDWSVIAARLAAIGVESRRFSFVTEQRVPEDVDVLVVAAPRKPWLPGEVAGLLDHVRSGGNLLWLIESPVSYPQPDAGAATGSGPSAAATDPAAARSVGPGLAALASELGVITEPGQVIDTASQSLVQGGPDFVVLGAHPQHPVTAALGSPLLLPQARALAVSSLAGQETRALLATPESSWTETGPLEGEVGFDEAQGEVAGPLVLGVTIERHDGPVDDNTVAAGQRIAVIGDADFGSSRFVGNGANAAFVESLLVWLAGEDRALEFVTETAPDASLELSNRTIVILSVLCLLVLPVSLLVIAALVRLRVRRG